MTEARDDGCLGADGDDGHDRRTGQCHEQAHPDRHEVVQTRRTDQPDRDDRQPDRCQDVAEEPIPPLQRQGAERDGDGTAHDRDDDAQLGPDPAPTEGQAGQEDHPQGDAE